MAIYGQYAQKFVKTSDLLFEFLNYMNESDKYITQLFTQDTMSLNEDLLALPLNDNQDKIKTSIIQKIKEIVDKFIEFVKNLIDKLIEIVHKFYIEHNLVDATMSKYKDIVTWNNIQKARTNGWHGIHKDKDMIYHIAEMEDSCLERDLKGAASEYNISSKDYIGQRDFEKLKNAKTYSEAYEIYEDIKYKLKKFATSSDSTSSIEFSNSLSNSLNILKRQKTYFFVTSKDKFDEDHYFPTKETFEAIKFMAEKGQKQNKEYKANIKNSLKTITQELQNIKLDYKQSDKKSPDEAKRIEYLYYKAYYEYVSIYVKRYSMTLKSICEIRTKQHSVAISRYIEFVAVIKKYAS